MWNMPLYLCKLPLYMWDVIDVPLSLAWACILSVLRCYSVRCRAIPCPLLSLSLTLSALPCAERGKDDMGSGVAYSCEA